jgi:hypothetical protein
LEIITSSPSAIRGRFVSESAVELTFEATQLAQGEVEVEVRARDVLGAVVPIGDGSHVIEIAGVRIAPDTLDQESRLRVAELSGNPEWSAFEEMVVALSEAAARGEVETGLVSMLQSIIDEQQSLASVLDPPEESPYQYCYSICEQYYCLSRYHSYCYEWGCWTWGRQCECSGGSNC